MAPGSGAPSRRHWNAGAGSPAAVAWKTTVDPGETDWERGAEAKTGATRAVTVSTASALAARPPELLTSTE